jgi:hypothetical protein
MSTGATRGAIGLVTWISPMWRGSASTLVVLWGIYLSGFESLTLRGSSLGVAPAVVERQVRVRTDALPDLRRNNNVDT